jgi:hypothetical protein
MTIRVRYLTLKLRALCWVLRRLRKHRPERVRDRYQKELREFFTTLFSVPTSRRVCGVLGVRKSFL